MIRLRDKCRGSLVGGAVGDTLEQKIFSYPKTFSTPTLL